MKNRSDELLRRLRAGEVLLADGACGTMLQAKGLDMGKVPEAWLLERPLDVLDLQRAYVEAGADILLACSFGGNRYRLEGSDLAGRVVEVSRRAAELARQAAGDGVFVAGDLGPTGQLLAPLGPLTVEAAANAYSEQATGLAEGGADLMLVETMSDLAEARSAVEGIRRVTDLPVVCTFSFDSHGRTMMGLRPSRAAREIGPLVEGIGANCGSDPSEFPEIIEAMGQALPPGQGVFLWAKPNAGLPHLVKDEVAYDAGPEYMAEIAVRLRQAGAQIIGGCCGTTPAHIEAMASALKHG